MVVDMKCSIVVINCSVCDIGRLSKPNEPDLHNNNGIKCMTMTNRTHSYGIFIPNFRANIISNKQQRCEGESSQTKWIHERFSWDEQKQIICIKWKYWIKNKK